MEKITVTVQIQAPLERVWEAFNGPEHIVKWAFATPEWEAPEAEVDLRVGGAFRTKMQAKDLSASFDFTGTYTSVVPFESVAYKMTDGREATISFSFADGVTTVTEAFDPESENPIDLQRSGWQAILNEFKRYVESMN